MDKPSWITENDYTALMLAKSLYDSPLKDYHGYHLVTSITQAAMWNHNQSTIIGIRGSVPGSKLDSPDLKKIYDGQSPETLDIVQEIKRLMPTVPPHITLTFSGHSLGGTAAAALCGEYPGSRGVGLNVGAPEGSNVKLPWHFTHYHVVGDIKSMFAKPGGETVYIWSGSKIGSEECHDVDILTNRVMERSD